MNHKDHILAHYWVTQGLVNAALLCKMRYSLSCMTGTANSKTGPGSLEACMFTAEEMASIAEECAIRWNEKRDDATVCREAGYPVLSGSVYKKRLEHKALHDNWAARKDDEDHSILEWTRCPHCDMLLPFKNRRNKKYNMTGPGQHLEAGKNRCIGPYYKFRYDRMLCLHSQAGQDEIRRIAEELRQGRLVHVVAV